MNKVQQAIMASDLEYQKRLADNNAKLLIRQGLRIKKVQELHSKDEHGYCTYCYTYMGTASFYPCPTIKALEIEYP